VTDRREVFAVAHTPLSAGGTHSPPTWCCSRDAHAHLLTPWRSREMRKQLYPCSRARVDHGADGAVHPPSRLSSSRLPDLAPLLLVEVAATLLLPAVTAGPLSPTDGGRVHRYIA